MRDQFYNGKVMDEEERTIYQQIIAYLLKELGNLKCTLNFNKKKEEKIPNLQVIWSLSQDPSNLMQTKSFFL